MTRLAFLMETDRTADPVPAAAHLLSLYYNEFARYL
jgi:hypothetical protein